MSKAIVINEFGGPEVLQWQHVELPAPEPEEVRVAHHAVGLNFIDTYQRSGLYPLELPSGLGLEAAGRVTAVGAAVDDFAVGDASTSLTSSAGGFQVHTGQHADPFYFYLGGFNNARASVLAVAGLTNNFNGLPNAAGCLPNGVMTTSLADLPNSTFPDVNIGQALRDQLTGARDANLATGSFAEDTFAANNVLALVVEIDKSSIAGSGEFFSVWASTHTTN